MYDCHPPGQCFILQVETDGYIYSPLVVAGGNQLDPSGRSLPKYVEAGDVIDFWNGGLYLPFEKECEEHCPVDQHTPI